MIRVFDIRAMMSLKISFGEWTNKKRRENSIKEKMLPRRSVIGCSSNGTANIKKKLQFIVWINWNLFTFSEIECSVNLENGKKFYTRWLMGLVIKGKFYSWVYDLMNGAALLKYIK